MAHADHNHAGHGLQQILTSTMATILGVKMNPHEGHMDHGAHGQPSGTPDMGAHAAHGHMANGRMDHGGMDHGGMDHGGMENGGMDHGGMDHSGMGHGMMMAFHGGYDEVVLFDNWRFTTVGGLIGSMVGIFFMAALYEGLKYYREYLFWKTYNALQYRSVTMPNEKSVVSDDNQIVTMVGEMIHKQPPTMFSWMHGFQTFLHIIQMVLSYFLMLIFMTYNVWLCLAVVAGAAVGYFLFGWKKSVIVDVTEHCH